VVAQGGDEGRNSKIERRYGRGADRDSSQERLEIRLEERGEKRVRGRTLRKRAHRAVDGQVARDESSSTMLSTMAMVPILQIGEISAMLASPTITCTPVLLGVGVRSSRVLTIGREWHRLQPDLRLQESARPGEILVVAPSAVFSAPTLAGARVDLARHEERITCGCNRSARYGTSCGPSGSFGVRTIAFVIRVVLER